MGFNAIFVDPVRESGSRLQNIGEQHEAFENIDAITNLESALKRVKDNTSAGYDVLCVSSKFDPLKVADFFEESRFGGTSKKAAPHVVVIDRESKNVSSRQFDISKPDNFLLEPVVTKDLNKVINCINGFDASQLKNHSRTKRARTKSEDKVTEVNYKVLCMRMSLAIDKGRHGVRELREIVRKIDNLTPSQQNRYFQELVEFFSALEMQ